MLDQARGPVSREKTEAVMTKALRGFLLLSVLSCLMVLLPGMAVPQDAADQANGPACGTEPDDADQVAAVREMAAEQCDCDTAASHDDYVSCVDTVTDAAIANGLLRPAR